MRPNSFCAAFSLHAGLRLDVNFAVQLLLPVLFKMAAENKEHSDT